MSEKICIWFVRQINTALAASARFQGVFTKDSEKVSYVTEWIQWCCNCYWI